MIARTTTAIGMKIHFGNGFVSLTTAACGISTRTICPSVKSSSGLVASATLRRNEYLSALAVSVAGVGAAPGLAAGGTGGGPSKVTTNCCVPPAGKSRSLSPVTCNHSCLVLSRAAALAMPRTGRELVLVTVNTASACPLLSALIVSLAVVVIVNVLVII